MKSKGFLNSNKIVVVAFIAVIPFVLYILVDFWYKNKVLSEKQQEKQLTQESFDKCMTLAYVEYRKDYRNMCWIYNHDATGCDLSYFKSYDISQELPEDKLKKEAKKCENDYPSKDRLYSSTSPDLELASYGEVSEKDAFKKLMDTGKYKEFIAGAKDMSGYKISYEATLPTKDNPYWSFRLYYYTADSEKTFGEYKVNALSGDILGL